jgi:hypothetical protein
MEKFEKWNIEVIPWIPKGCDISIIENVWSLIKDHLMERIKEIKNSKDVWRITEEFFYSQEMT